MYEEKNGPSKDDSSVTKSADIRQRTNELKKYGIVISNANAKWTNAQAENSLDSISLTVRPGRLVAIIGPVGAGKVSFNKIETILKKKNNKKIVDKIKSVITEFVIASDSPRITPFRGNHIRVRFRFVRIPRTMVVRRFGSTEYSIRLNDEPRTL